VRIAFSAILVVTGVLCALSWNVPFRTMEASLAAGATNAFFPAQADGFRWMVGPVEQRSVILVITTSCSSSMLVTPLSLAAGWLLLLPRMAIGYTLLGYGLAAGLLVGLSTCRQVMIGLAWHEWGNVSLWLSHDFVGSLLSLAAGVIALGALFYVSGKGNFIVKRQFD
jgi:exosortase/archaeosortase family protein